MGEWSRKRWEAFTEKQRFAILAPEDETPETAPERHDDDQRENVLVKWHIFISPMRITVGFVGLVLILFLTVFILLAYTPAMNVIPGYPGSKSREMLLSGIMRLDSLEREMAHLTVYSDNIALIMEGKTPIIRDVTRIGDSVQIQEKRLIPPSVADSILRARMRGAGEYGLAGSLAAMRETSRTLDLVAPAQGLVQTQFDPRTGQLGVEVLTISNQPVVAVREGNVMLVLWTPDEGSVVQIQHSDNLVSSYKHLSSPKVRVGERVKSGQIIATAGSTDGDEAGVAKPFGFELWHNGTPVNPESYIVF